jgi:chromosome segregation ATPase
MPSPTVEIKLEDILVAIQKDLNDLKNGVNDLKVSQAEIKGEIKTLDEKLTGQITALDQRLTGQITALDQRLTGQITALDQRLTGQINTLDEKVSGIGKRVENQEFLNRGVLTALIIALIAGAAKIFGWLPPA